MIINWKKQCQKIDDSKIISKIDPADKKIHLQQEIYYIKFLIINGSDYDECYEKWKLIKNGIANNFENDIEQQKIEFKKLYNRAQKISENIFKENKVVNIYKEEIDYFNSLQAPMWVKQYWLAMLVYYKFQKTMHKEVKYSSTIRSWAFRQVNEVLNHQYSNHSEAIRKYELNNGSKIIMVDTRYIKKKKQTYVVYNMPCCKNSGDVVAVCSDIEEVSSLFDLLKNQKQCEACGMFFDFSGKTKRNVCETCYKKQRRVYKTVFERSRRQKMIQK